MSSPKRVGILTFHRCINYGSYWQARCLAEGLRARGHDAVLLDHHSRRINLAEWRVALHPIPDAPPASHRSAYVQKARKFFEAFDRLPLSQPFPLLEPEQSEACDVVLVGSDEVWNLRHPWYGGKGIFYGDGLNAGLLASYAASFGNQSASGGLEGYWSSRLKRFDAISVRDQNSQSLVAEATGRTPPLVLDPCLQFAHLIPKVPPLPEREPYALVYGHGFPEWLQQSMRQWANNQGVQLLSIGYENAWADEQLIGAGPMEFAAIVAGARAVVTNFFHGCVFALVNGKPFVTAPSDYRFNKVRDLVGALGAERHMVSPETTGTQFQSILNDVLDPQIGHTIAAMRIQSDSYLDHVLA
ncbi:polysaccharide pyruvyl transferase family protein [Devosia submarina]|uniref:polysaccharide pyruvyl transferase family protein n=1 Tax=Devosia submarina TaxID=1173082 RepID=UPI000D3C24BE|nr:polysaccharide pyruvyl transferase family protein [Devosia submarina]